MKTIVYLRIAKTKRGVKFDASEKPNQTPLKVGRRFIPTVAFGVELDIPDEVFKGAGLLIGLLKLSTEEVKIASKIKIPKLTP